MRSVLRALCVLFVSLGAALPASAALEIVVAVSPVEAMVGQPVEVLVRTFVPTGRDELALPDSSLSYPAASGVANILYPLDDYPFDVIAESDATPPISVRLSRSGDDATLWRGTFTPEVAGTWTVTVRNWPKGHPGTATQLRVVPGDTVPVPALAAGGGFLVGLLLALAIQRRRPARS